MIVIYFGANTRRRHSVVLIFATVGDACPALKPNWLVSSCLPCFRANIGKQTVVNLPLLLLVAIPHGDVVTAHMMR